MLDSKDGQYSVNEIANLKKMSVRGARRYMQILEDHPLLEFEQFNNGKPGRPAKCVSQPSWHVFERLMKSRYRNLSSCYLPIKVLCSLGDPYETTPEEIKEFCSLIPPFQEKEIIAPKNINLGILDMHGNPVIEECFIDKELELWTDWRFLKDPFFLTPLGRKTRNWHELEGNKSFTFTLEYDFITQIVMNFLRFRSEININTYFNLTRLKTGFVYTCEDYPDLINDSLKAGEEIKVTYVSPSPEIFRKYFDFFMRNEFDVTCFYYYINNKERKNVE